MTNHVMFKGVIPPVSTIFQETGELDRVGMGKLIDFLIDAGVHGLFFNGTGGEFSQMSTEQRQEVATFAVDYVDRRCPVLIGTGSASTVEAIELSKHAEKIGADAIVVINPYFWKLSEEFLFQHFSDIAKSVNIPMLLYNFPALTGQDITPELALRLADTHSNIVGIKESVDEAGHYREMILKIKPKHPSFSVLVGFDDHLLNNLSLGGDGVVPASANFIPQFTINLYNAYVNGDYEKAIELQKKVAYLPLFYKIASPFVGVAKEAMNMVGLEVSTSVLSPTRGLNNNQIREIKSLLKTLNVI